MSDTTDHHEQPERPLISDDGMNAIRDLVRSVLDGYQAGIVKDPQEAVRAMLAEHEHEELRRRQLNLIRGELGPKDSRSDEECERMLGGGRPRPPVAVDFGLRTGWSIGYLSQGQPGPEMPPSGLNADTLEQQAALVYDTAILKADEAMPRSDIEQILNETQKEVRRSQSIRHMLAVHSMRRMMQEFPPKPDGHLKGWLLGRLASPTSATKGDSE